MNHPGAEIQGAIYDALIGSATLDSLIGSGRVYDQVPAQTRPPYVTFGKSLHIDWSTDTESGIEHEIELHVWTRENGRKEIYAIAQTLTEILTPLAGVMNDHTLVNFTHLQTQIEAHDKNKAFLGNISFRAVSELTNF